MNLYNEHLAKYLADERYRQLAYEAERARIAKKHSKRRRPISLRKALAQLGIFARFTEGADAR